MAAPYIVGGPLDLSMFTPAADISPSVASPVRQKDQIYGGMHRIVGTVKEKAAPSNLPLVRKVFLHLEGTGTILRETWSDANGNYRFEYLDGRPKYYVVAFDYLNNYRAVVADNLTPEAM